MIDTTHRQLFEQLLAHYEEVSITVVNADGLSLPAHVMPKGATTTLIYGLDQPTPIPDLVVDDEGIRATLSFSRTPCETFVPWLAVVAMDGLRERPRQRAKLRSV